MNSQEPDNIIEDILRLKRFAPFRRIIMECDTILDVGGGSGRTWNLNGIVDKDISLLDIDISYIEDPCPYSHLICDDAMNAFLFAGDFDAVCAMGLLEHLPDPVSFLHSFLHSAPKFIYLTVPNAESFHRHVGYHLGIIDSLDELGLQDVAIGHQRVYTMNSLMNHISLSEISTKYFIREMLTTGFKFDTSTAMAEMEIDKIFAMQTAAEKTGILTKQLGAEICVLLERFDD